MSSSSGRSGLPASTDASRKARPSGRRPAARSRGDGRLCFGSASPAVALLKMELLGRGSPGAAGIPVRALDAAPPGNQSPGRPRIISAYFSMHLQPTGPASAGRPIDLQAASRLTGQQRNGRRRDRRPGTGAADARGRGTRVQRVLQTYFPRVFRFALPRLNRNEDDGQGRRAGHADQGDAQARRLPRRGGAVHLAVPDLPPRDRRPRALAAAALGQGGADRGQRGSARCPRVDRGAGRRTIRCAAATARN